METRVVESPQNLPTPTPTSSYASIWNPTETPTLTLTILKPF